MWAYGAGVGKMWFCRGQIGRDDAAPGGVTQACAGKAEVGRALTRGGGPSGRDLSMADHCRPALAWSPGGRGPGGGRSVLNVGGGELGGGAVGLADAI